jgi:hypothetical protein
MQGKKRKNVQKKKNSAAVQCDYDIEGLGGMTYIICTKSSRFHLDFIIYRQKRAIEIS